MVASYSEDRRELVAYASKRRQVALHQRLIFSDKVLGYDRGVLNTFDQPFYMRR